MKKEELKQGLLELFMEFNLAREKYNQSKPAFEDNVEPSLRNFIRWIEWEAMP